MRCLIVLALFSALTLSAQTYTPKTIRFEGVPASDIPHLLDLLSLAAGTPVTKEQIEAGLQHLSDTGLFSDISYKVDASALVVILTPSPSNQAYPVRFGNIVWWQPAELEKLLEARVPLYHGELSLNGTLTDRVTDAVVAMLEDKGVHAKVSTLPAASGNAITVVITQPSIVLGNIQIVGASPEAEKQILKLQGYLGGQDFNLDDSPKAIDHGVEQFFHSAGFLDTAADPPSFGPPHKDPTTAQDRYLIDTQITVRDAALYRVSNVSIQEAPPVSQKELLAALKVHPNDPATIYDRGVATVDLTTPYHKRGYLDAEAQLDAPRDTVHHTIAYHFTMVPGQQYRSGHIDISSLTPENRASFLAAWHIAPGELLDEDYLPALQKVIDSIQSPMPIAIHPIPNQRSKIEDFVLLYIPAGSATK